MKKPTKKEVEDKMLEGLNNFMKDFGIDEITFGNTHKIKKTKYKKADKNINMTDKEVEELYDFYCKSFEDQDIIEQLSFDTGPMNKFMFNEKLKNLDWFRSEWISKLNNSKK